MTTTTLTPDQLTLRAYSAALGAVPHIEELLETTPLTEGQDHALRSLVHAVKAAEWAWTDRTFGQG